MTHAQIWLISGHPVLVYASTTAIEGDITQASPAVVIKAEIDGDDMGAEQLRAAMTITNGVLSVTGRNVISQVTTTR